MRRAYHQPTPWSPRPTWKRSPASLTAPIPGAAASLRLPETLTIARLGVPPTLARTLRGTNSVKSTIAICRDHAANVKRWRDGQMVLRWMAAGMDQARKQFRRVNGHLHLAALRAGLDQTVPAHPPRRMPPDHRPSSTASGSRPGGFVKEPGRMDYGGIDAVFDDPCGNPVNLHQD
jgi:putative transposase